MRLGALICVYVSKSSLNMYFNAIESRKWLYGPILMFAFAFYLPWMNWGLNLKKQKTKQKQWFGHLSASEIDQKRSSSQVYKASQLESSKGFAILLGRKGHHYALLLNIWNRRNWLKFWNPSILTPQHSQNFTKKSSLEGLTHRINKHLRSSPYNKELDIINDSLFRKANNNFCSALEELKQEGKGDKHYYPAISSKDLEKLYLFKELDIKCNSTLDTFSVDVARRTFVCCMCKDSFRVEIHERKRYVMKAKDELTKMHGDYGQSYSGFIPESLVVLIV